jgi:hypothetical protein
MYVHSAIIAKDLYGKTPSEQLPRRNSVRNLGRDSVLQNEDETWDLQNAHQGF